MNYKKLSGGHVRANQTRRKLVLGATAGATAVTVWQKPVIESVILPAHAQTSPMQAFFGAGVTATPTAQLSPLDFLISPAVAGGGPIQDEYTVAVQANDESGESFTVGVFESFPVRDEVVQTVEVVYEGTVTMAAGGTLDPAQNPCEFKLESIDVEISAVNPTSIVLNFTNRNQTVEVPEGDGALPTPMCILRPQPDNFFGSSLSPGNLEASAQQQASPLDLFIGTANAGLIPIGDTANISATRLSQNNYQVQYQDIDGTIWGAALELDVEATMGVIQDPCNIGELPTVTGEILSITDDFLTLRVTIGGGGNLDYSVPDGSGSLSAICLD